MGKHKRARKPTRKMERELTEREERALEQVRMAGRREPVPPSKFHKTDPRRDVRQDRRETRVQLRKQEIENDET